MSTLRVYLVEDHPIVLESLTELFAYEEGFEVAGSATTADDAFDALATANADVVVTDISLPGMSGLDLCRALCTRTPDINVLIVSGHQDRIYSEQARTAGARGFVTKTAIATELVPALRLIASGGSTFA
jgi:DNA-binding NarL/FixJ family response regulator